MRAREIAWGCAWLLLLGGCAASLSPAVRREATPVKGLEAIRAAPDSLRGKTVILGGEIVETRNHPEATTLVVLEKPLDVFRKPRDVDATGGRFLVTFSRYLDPVLYAKGRRVTVAGVVSGAATEPVGDAPYRYVVLEGVEAHLWTPSREVFPSSSYRYPWWYDGGRRTPPW
ncbi:MAG: Slp family lipoprotein [Deltaproteobacteria bacterium]|nr:Slp family lipoprotein [Deltaproteobacteria bacterium]